MWIRSLAVLLALTLGAGTALSSPDPDKMHEHWRPSVSAVAEL